jgi:hypothetical protein
MPARILGNFGILLALLIRPGVLGRMISLDWVDGNLRTPAKVNSAGLSRTLGPSWTQTEPPA